MGYCQRSGNHSERRPEDVWSRNFDPWTSCESITLARPPRSIDFYWKVRAHCIHSGFYMHQPSLMNKGGFNQGWVLNPGHLISETKFGQIGTILICINISNYRQTQVIFVHKNVFFTKMCFWKWLREIDCL